MSGLIDQEAMKRSEQASEDALAALRVARSACQEAQEALAKSSLKNVHHIEREYVKAAATCTDLHERILAAMKRR